VKLSHSRSKHRSNGRARLLPSVRLVQLGMSIAIPFIRPIVFVWSNGLSGILYQ
jgi:hypothetical protein